MKSNILHQIISNAKTELKDELTSDPMRAVDLDDMIMQIADSNVPVYPRELLEVALCDLELSTTCPENGPAYNGEVTAVSCIAANVYELLINELYDHAAIVLTLEKDTDYRPLTSLSLA